MGRPWARSILVLLALASCRAEPVPAELIHVWRTDAPAYQDRYLELRKDMLVFGTGGLMSELYPIVGIDSEPSDDGSSTLYTVHYRAQDGARLALKLAFKRGDPNSLRIEHLDDDWHVSTGPTGPVTGG